MYLGVGSNSDSVREYKEAGTKYTYYAGSKEIANRYCIITYPDGTTLKTNNVKTVYNHIIHHRKLINLDNKYNKAIPGDNTQFVYAQEFNIYFTSLKKISINSLLNNRKKITINELLNN
jgi:hypothetical protein